MGFRTLRVGNTDPKNSRVYFDVRLTDGSVATSEVGNQPQLSLNGASWNTTGIGVLVDIGFGSYYADFTTSFISNLTPGDIIRTRYKGTLTLETPGDTFQIIDDDIVTPIPTTSSVAQLSYISVNSADQYFNSRVNSTIWFENDYNGKFVALKHATRLIDRLNFAGEKTDPNQLLQFPRKSVPIISQSGFGNIPNLPDQDHLEETEPDDEDETSLVIDVDIPVDIQIACCEIAIALLDGRDIDLDIENLAVDSQSQAGIRTSYSRKYALEHVRAGIPSALAWNYLRPYLRDFRAVIISRSS